MSKRSAEDEAPGSPVGRRRRVIEDEEEEDERLTDDEVIPPTQEVPTSRKVCLSNDHAD